MKQNLTSSPQLNRKSSGYVFILMFAITCFGSLATTKAVVPAPDGGYPGGNTAEGQNALFSLTTGGYNTAAGYLSLTSNTIGQLNTAVGAGALLANTADENTAMGAGALLANSSGIDNTADGAFALAHNTAGIWNTATGVNALFTNSGGNYNAAFGVQSLYSNTTGANNTAAGTSALFSNTQGNDNTAVGADALQHNTGSFNTAVGRQALLNNSTGTLNTAVGVQALLHATGSGNIAWGVDAGSNVTTGQQNIIIGNDGGPAADSGTIRIGSENLHTRTFISGIYEVTTGNNDAVPVLIDDLGQTGTKSPSRRFKTDIKPIEKASECILALKPVSFRYKVHKDSTPQFGLIAEEVAAVNPDLVVRDKKGEIYTVRYDAVKAMLLNEVLKEHRTVEELKGNAEDQRRNIQALAATVKEQASLIQKVSAQLQIRKSTRQVVLNKE